MSFNDFSRSNQGSNPNSAKQKDPISQLSDSLQLFQKNCQATRDKITEMKTRKVGLAEKNELDMQLKDIRSQEQNLKNQIDFQFQQLEGIARPEVAQKRAMLTKLQKDYERIKTNVQSLSNEAMQIKATREIGESEQFVRIGNNNTTNGNNRVKGAYNSNNDNDRYTSKYSGDGSMQNQNSNNQFNNSNSLDLKPILTGQEVDDAILEERERDILKLNQDMQMVNEMFKDMAEIVGKQGEQIEEIGKATDTTHAQTKAGLDQVKSAAAYQPTCVIS